MKTRLRRKGNTRATLWHDTVRKNYGTLDELESFDSIYGIAGRCGYKTPAALWKANPMLQGSTNPEDFGVALYVSLRKAEGIFEGHPWVLEHGDGVATGYTSKAKAATAMRDL